MQAREEVIRLDCTSLRMYAGYPDNIEGESERGGTDLAATNGSGTAMALSEEEKEEMNSPLVSCSERGHCEITVCLILPVLTLKKQEKTIKIFDQCGLINKLSY